MYFVAHVLITSEGGSPLSIVHMDADGENIYKLPHDKVEIGEAPLNTALRIAEKQLGAKLSPSAFVPVCTDQVGHEIHIIYSLNYNEVAYKLKLQDSIKFLWTSPRKFTSYSGEFKALYQNLF